MTENQLNNYHELCTNNGEYFRSRSIEVGCFHCCLTYWSWEVEEYLKGRPNHPNPEKRYIEDTAICPKCGIDSVIPMDGTVNLEEMERYWFGY